ncbi:AraC family transcriptional regulator [Marinomonas fungiae]|uniref:AraC-type DNA-binding domain and AraC-containing proteins n=1 Tax=Marinomonas fungiae TaxID=1137284 RepID=A0A0K6IN35_9GAMM|nr:AraC family transcriptional regulator [Marinomonas fungiae]CUB04501.1 AraC-type DNA-binding domain and AraC-containing proteins [Marinomonas fungiae]
MSDDNRFTFMNSQGLKEVMLLQASMTDFAYSTHAHEEYSIGVTLTGRQDFYTQGTFHKSHPGQIMVFNPGDAHDGESGDDTTLTYSMLYIHPEQFKPYLTALEVANPEQFRIQDAVFSDLEVQDKILRLARLIELKTATSSEYESLLFELTEQLVRYQSQQPLMAETRRQLLLERAKEYLQDHYQDEVSLDDLCRVACMSKYHFLRCFKAYTGMTPHQYWLNVRIHRGQQALRSGVPVLDVMSELGFNDLSHFNRRFKPVFGMTPRQYQQLILAR